MEEESSDEILRGLILATTKDIGPLFGLSVSFIKRKRYPHALKILEKITKLDPNFIDAWCEKGHVLAELGNYDEAMSCFDQALKINNNCATAWADKGTVLGRLGKFEESIKYFDKAIRFNKNTTSAWVGKGASLSKLGKNDEAIQFIDGAIEIDTKNSTARFNKGVLLRNLGRFAESIKNFDEAIELDPENEYYWLGKASALDGLKDNNEEMKCVDKALDINPYSIIAWFHKGCALSDLERFEEAIECFDNVISIEPNYAEAHANKGIILFDEFDYIEAEKEFKIWKDIFSDRGMTDEVKRANEYLLLAANAQDLLQMIGPFDKIFLASLESESLTELRKSIEFNFKEFSDVVDEYSEKKMPSNVKSLLSSKLICWNALLNALNFNEVNLKDLSETKSIFEKWNLYEYIIVVNSLDSFVRILGKYDGFENIPKDKELLLLSLLNKFNVLDGKFTRTIVSGIGLEPYAAKFVGIDPESPRMIEIPIKMELTGESIRVCLAQLEFGITQRFPYELIDKEKTKSKIMKLIRTAKDNNVDIICFPELSFSKDFLAEICEYKDIVIVGGSYYENNFNVCPVIISGQIYSVYKINPSPHLEIPIAPGKGMIQGNDIKIFNIKNKRIRFVVLICMDYLKESWRLYNQIGKNERVNIIFNPQFNSDVGRFQRLANSECENHFIDIMQINVKEYGGTCVIGREHKDIIKRFISEGYREKDEITYKICEVKRNEEIAIIVDINVYKEITVPTPIESLPTSRISLFGRYQHRDDQWVKLN